MMFFIAKRRDKCLDRLARLAGEEEKSKSLACVSAQKSVCVRHS